jgi:hypothetical protein
LSSKTKRFWGIIIGFLLAGVLLNAIVSIIQFIIKLTGYTVEWANSFLWTGTIISFILLAVQFGRYINTYSEPLTWTGIRFSNPLFDSEAKEKLNILDNKIFEENKNLLLQIEQLKKLSVDYDKENEKNLQNLIEANYISDIFVRHHINANRLLSSLLNLWQERKKDWLLEFCNNVLDECVTTLTKDRADKSSSIFFVDEYNILKMYAYNRVDFNSSRERAFNKGDGFAGSIWENETPEIIQGISNDPRFQGEFSPNHRYDSILGYPIKIGKDVIGVLCVSSESEDGLNEDDLIMVEFYAGICALARFCDIIDSKVNDKEG